MLFQKRNCPLEIELIPRGAGWTHVYLTTGGERLFFYYIKCNGTSVQ
jgi:hypothetical protein